MGVPSGAMKAQRAAAAHTAAAALACWCSAADAYRPFDGTDAAVAETGEVEIELGPVEYLREGAGRTLLAPDLRINYGFIPGWEAALEGKVAHGLTAGIPGTSLVESDALLKGVLREGSLQEKPGPSIATEFGVLLPGINDEHGTGAVLNGIVSQRWDWGTAHVNAQIALTREQHADYFLDTIIEGPRDWVVRPVAEISTNAMLACFEPARPSLERSGRSRTISRSTSGCAVRASMITPPERSVPELPSPSA